jgi:acetyl esterase/lipase
MPLSSFPWAELLWPTGASSQIAGRLFIHSLCIVDNYITKEGAVFADFFTACLHKLIPVSWQNAFRELGGISYLSDLSAYFLAYSIGIYNLQAVLDMAQISRKISRFQYGATVKHTLEVFRPVNSIINLTADTPENKIISPVKRPKTLVFVHGGAWGCGQLWQYRLVANGIGNIIGACSVVLIGYPTYPTAGIIEQSECVTHAVQYIRQNDTLQQQLLKNRTSADEFDINYTADSVFVPHHITDEALVLCGHSSGANICALSMLHNAHQPSSSASAADVFVGLCGPYNIVKHYLFEERRGVHLVSPMTAAAGGKAGLPLCSPTLVAESMLTDSTITSYKPIASQLPHSVLIHGSRDETVPVSSTVEYGVVLSKLGFSNQVIISNVSLVFNTVLLQSMLLLCLSFVIISFFCLILFRIATWSL